MVGIFDSSIVPEFYPEMRKAEEVAIQEAANTGGILMRVQSARIKRHSILFVGTVSKLLFLSRLSTKVSTEVTYMEVEADTIGKFHTTWGSISGTNGLLGILNISGFPSLMSCRVEEEQEPEDYNDDEVLVVGVKTPRIALSELPEEIGIRLCHDCGKEIGERRIKIIPDARHCLSCAKAMERRI